MQHLLTGLAALLIVCGTAGSGAGSVPESGWKWRLLESSPPLNDFESGTAFDTDADRLVLWGGHNNFGGPQRAETWLFNPDAETWELVEPANRPISACCARDMVYDAANKATYFLGAHHYSHGWMWRAPLTRAGGYPWAYDIQANTWRCMKPLVYSSSPWTGGVYHPEHQVVLTYGGQYISERNVWAYDGYTNEWTEIRRDGDGPGVAGMLAPLTYDSHRGVVLYYDGGRGDDGERAALWQYDLATNKWERLTAEGGERPRRSHNMFVYDHINRLPILFAAADGNLAAFGFDYDAKQWKKLATEGDAPPGYSIQQGAYDSKRHRTIFANGGIYNVRNRRAVYAFEHARSASPPAAAPAAPSDVKATSTTTGHVEIAFRPAEGAARHEVHRGSGRHIWQVTFEKLGDANGGRFVDPQPAKDAVNFYFVKAVFGDGREANSLKVRAQPRIPQQPVVSVLDEKRIEITWPASSEPDVAGYNVYEVSGGQREGRTARGAPELKKLNDAPLAATSITVTLESLPAQGDRGGRRYIVRAVNRLGVESGNSPWADTFASEPTGVIARTESGKPVVTWKPNPEKGIAGYNVHRLDGGNNARKIAGPLTETKFVDETRTERGRCKYYIVPIDALGREGRASYGAWLDGGLN